MQLDLDKLSVWSDTWKTKFNKEKCEVMQFGANNSCYDYQIGGHTLAKTTKE